MALSKIQAESMNLADTFAFTGTVSGTGDLTKVFHSAWTSDVAQVLANNVVTTSFLHYKIFFRVSNNFCCYRSLCSHCTYNILFIL